jgi:hypothetical protein
MPMIVEILCLDGDGSFGPTVGWTLLKTPAIIASYWGDRQVESIKFAAALASRGAFWLPGAALASLGAGDALRGAGKLRRASRKNDWIRLPVHSGGPSSLSPQPIRAPKAAMDSSSYVAHAYILGTRFCVRAAEGGHFTLLSAHGCMACQEYWLPTHPMNANDTGECAERGACASIFTGPCADYLKSWPNRRQKNNSSRIKKTARGNRQGKGVLRYV